MSAVLPEGLARLEAVRRGLVLGATLPRPPVGCTPHQVVHRQNKLVIRHYPAQGPQPQTTPLVVVPSLINKASICDLEPGRSLVAGMSERGHPVYLVDWGTPGPEDADHGVDTILLDLLHRSIDRVCRHARSPQAHLLGYCQGGTLAAMYAALRPRRVGSLMALNAPVDFAHAGRFARFVDPAHCDAQALVGDDGLVPVDLMQSAFRMLDPVGLLGRYESIDRATASPALLARTMARERWLEENVPVPGRFAREFIVHGYQQNRLLAGTWTVGHETVELRRIQAPTHVVACERDFIAPVAACLPLADAVGSTVARTSVLPTGHIGVVVGSAGPRVFYPLVDQWLRAPC